MYEPGTMLNADHFHPVHFIWGTILWAESLREMWFSQPYKRGSCRSSSLVNFPKVTWSHEQSQVLNPGSKIRSFFTIQCCRQFKFNLHWLRNLVLSYVKFSYKYALNSFNNWMRERILILEFIIIINLMIVMDNFFFLKKLQNWGNPEDIHPN